MRAIFLLLLTTATLAQTPSPSHTPTSTATDTRGTSTPTATFTDTGTPTETPTETPIRTRAPRPTATATATNTPFVLWYPCASGQVEAASIVDRPTGTINATILATTGYISLNITNLQPGDRLVRLWSNGRASNADDLVVADLVAYHDEVARSIGAFALTATGNRFQDRPHAMTSYLYRDASFRWEVQLNAVGLLNQAGMRAVGVEIIRRNPGQ